MSYKGWFQSCFNPVRLPFRSFFSHLSQPPEHLLWRSKFYFSLFFGIPLTALHYALMYNRRLSPSPPSNFLYILMFILATPVQYVVALPFARKAYKHLTRTGSR